MKSATFTRFTWRGYTVEAEGWHEHVGAEFDNISIRDDNNVELDHLTLLIECENGDAFEEISNLFLESVMGDMADRMADNYYED